MPLDQLQKKMQEEAEDEMPFTKCRICKEMRKAQLECKDMNKRFELDAEHRAHVHDVRRERETYWKNRQLARDYPQQYASITIDAADQSDFHLPEADKFTAAAYKVKTPVVGALMHGRAPLCFISGNQCKQGNNVTIQALWECIVHLHNSTTGVPPIIFLQLDNTTKQNKSKYLVAFCELLVHFKVCKEIRINFLPVGHTHEDIDQFFSRLAMLLRRTDALSLEHLASIIPTSYKTQEGLRPIVKIWEELANISDWLDANKVRDFPNIMSYRAFRIAMGAHGRPIVQVKANMSERVKDDPWRGPSADVPESNRKTKRKTSASKPYPEQNGTCWPPKKAIPDLVEAAHNGEIPPSQACDVMAGRLAKHVQGLETLDALSEVQYPAVHRARNLGLLLLEAKDSNDRPIHVLPFNWSKELMRTIFSGAAALAPSPPEAPLVLARVRPAVKIKVGHYFIITPFEKADHYPFYIGKVRADAEEYDDDDGAQPRYRVQFLWPAVWDNGAKFATLGEWLDCEWNTMDKDNLGMSSYTLVDADEFHQEISMNGGGVGVKTKAKTKMTIRVQGDNGRTAARAWGVKLGVGRNLNCAACKDYL